MKRQLLSASMMLVLVLLLVAVASPEAPLPTEHFSYFEDFEGKDPVLFWVGQGQYEVNFKGITDERAFSGKRSFKLDLTLKDSGAYSYWHVPVKVPCAGRLKLSARILVEQVTNGRVGLGANFLFPPTHHSGCKPFRVLDKPTVGWKLQTCDLVERGDIAADQAIRRHVSGATGQNVMAYLDRWGLFIYGGKGDRVVLYVDDVEIEGDVPRVSDYRAEGHRRWESVREAFLKKLACWRDELALSLSRMEMLDKASSVIDSVRRTALQSAAFVRDQLARFSQRGYASPEEVQEVNARAKLVSFMSKPENAQSQYLIYAVKAITNDKILPGALPMVDRIGRDLEVTACRGEYEPVSFAVYALSGLKGLRITPTDLTSENAVIPAGAVDIRVVKCWFQSGMGVRATKQRLLVPELLLKDDKLVRVDLESRQNYLRDVDTSGKQAYILISGSNSDNMKHIQPRDTETLQPVDIEAGTTRQFWITVRAPENATPGQYKGRIQLAFDGAPSTDLTLSFHVLPFDLEKPLLRYSIYYRGRLTRDGKGSISSEQKSPQQYEAEMGNLRAHGVEYPTVYQSYDEKLLTSVFQIRKMAGLPTGPLYTLGIGTGNPSAQQQLDGLKRGVRNWIAIAKKHGYDDVYVYGIDEAKGEHLKSQRAAWRAVHEVGGKVFVACHKGAFELTCDLLDLAILAGQPLPQEAAKYHRVSHQVFCYANPQGGVEQPETYRRNFGLLLWKKGYDGAMDYAYQHSYNHGWNDFDHDVWRDHNFTYPTVGGVIDTIEWEGFREGVDDVRYLTTLSKAIEKARVEKPGPAKQAQEWLDRIDVNSDLDELRRKMIEWVMRLQ